MSGAVEPHEEDDCEDCQKERKQNNQLVDFYERIGKIKDKVKSIHPKINQISDSSNVDCKKLNKIAEKMAVSPESIGQNYDSKQIGYQMACALMERQIRIKKENEMLMQKIKELKIANQNNSSKIVEKRDSEVMSQNFSVLENQTKSRSFSLNNRQAYTDSLDTALDQSKSFWGTNVFSSEKAKQKKQTSRYQSSFSSTKNPLNSSTFSNFQETGGLTFGETAIEKNNLNLWLYQVNVEQHIVPVTKLQNTMKRKK